MSCRCPKWASVNISGCRYASLDELLKEKCELPIVKSMLLVHNISPKTPWHVTMCTWIQGADMARISISRSKATFFKTFLFVGCSPQPCPAEKYRQDPWLPVKEAKGVRNPKCCRNIKRWFKLLSKAHRTLWEAFVFSGVSEGRISMLRLLHFRPEGVAIENTQGKSKENHECKIENTRWGIV